jgi:hypothetical protein
VRFHVSMRCLVFLISGLPRNSISEGKGGLQLTYSIRPCCLASASGSAIPEVSDHLSRPKRSGG